jgi:MerR family transcriptional regulator/heat shock protein HspR
MTEHPESDTARGVFGMSVAAELVGLDPQSLRLYERRGLIQPHRTGGGTRRYSSDDLDQLRRIKDLLAAGLNLAGIAMVLDLEADNDTLRTQARNEDTPVTPTNERG